MADKRWKIVVEKPGYLVEIWEEDDEHWVLKQVPEFTAKKIVDEHNAAISKEKLDFRKMLSNMIDGNSDEVDFCIKFAEDHQAKGDMTDEAILKGLIEVLAMDSNRNKSREVIRYNEMIAEGIRGLLNMRHWTNFTRIAGHAIESEIKVLEQERAPFNSMVPALKIRNAVLHAGSDSFGEIFKKEYLDTFGFKAEA